MHSRLANQRGKASLLACVACGASAHHWSYNHADPNEKEGPMSNGRIVKYSVDLSFYEPLCARCHLVRDGAHEGRWGRR